MAEFSIIIPTLGNYDGLARVLTGLDSEAVAEGAEFELVVAIDRADPNPDRVAELLAGRPYPARSVRPERAGSSANRNAGVAASSGPLVLFCDDDTVPVRGLLAAHHRWHRSHPEPEVGVLGHVRWAPRVEVTAFMRWLDYGIQFDYPNIEGTEAGWGRFYSANVSVKRELFDRVGGFDEVRLPYLYEDLDFGYRASKLGFRLLYNRSALVDHERTMDLDFWREKVDRLARAEYAFCSKHPEVAPYFRDLFAGAAAKPPARGRGRHLIRRIPRRLPLVGPYLWTSADIYYRQAIAPAYLEAWEEAVSLGESDGSASQLGGSSPGGPK